MIRGYITKMFGPADAAKYLSHLLQVDARHIQFFRLPQLGIVVVVHPAVQHAKPITAIANRPAWLLDYTLRAYGTVVPQSLYSPASAVRVFQPNENVPLSMPIFFVHQRGTLGLPLTEIAASQGWGLVQNGSALIPGNHNSSTCIRINASVFSRRSSSCV